MSETVVELTVIATEPCVFLGGIFRTCLSVSAQNFKSIRLWSLLRIWFAVWASASRDTERIRADRAPYILELYSLR
jgi:hypothetical protein